MKLLPRLLQVCLLLGLCLPHLSAQAARVENLYTTSSLVADASDATRLIEASHQLQQLMVRVSGSRNVLAHWPPEDYTQQPEVYADDPRVPLWQKLLDAQRWVVEYQYQTTHEILIDESGREIPAQRLNMQFDPQAITQLARELQVPVWDINRPQTLFWILLEGRQGRYLVTQESNPVLAQHLQLLGAQRGVPTELPDLQRFAAPASLLSDIWGGFNEQILQASADYQPDAVVVGLIRPAGNRWDTRWTLLTGLNTTHAQYAVETLGEALDQGMDFTAEQLSRLYASSAEQTSGQYRIVVSGVDQLTDYATLLGYLENLALAQQVSLVKVQQNQFLFEVAVQGSLAQLKANLALDNRLQEQSFVGLQQVQASLASDAETAETTDQNFWGRVDAYFTWQAGTR